MKRLKIFGLVMLVAVMVGVSVVFVGCGRSQDVYCGEIEMPEMCEYRRAEIEQSIEDFLIIQYYLGTFGDVSVIFLSAAGAGDIVWSETVGGVTFNYADGRRLWAWQNGNLYNLQKAYAQRFLTRANLRVVGNIWNCRNSSVSEFDYTLIMVSLTEEASSIEREWATNDFPEFSFSQIRNLGMIGTRIVLVLYLSEPSRENALLAVYLIGQREDIQFAELNWLDSGD